jgi:hypothetical protein
VIIAANRQAKEGLGCWTERHVLQGQAISDFSCVNQHIFEASANNGQVGWSERASQERASEGARRERASERAKGIRNA